MAATYRSNSVLGAASGVNGTLAAPSGRAAGDIILFSYHLEDDISITEFNGAIGRGSEDHAGSAYDSLLFSKLVGGAEPTYLFTHASTWRTGIAVCVQGGHPGIRPKVSRAQATGTPTPQAPAVTPIADDAFFQYVAETFADQTNLITPPTNYTEQWESANNLYVATRDKTGGGGAAEGPISVGLGGNFNWVAHLTAIENSGATATVPVWVQVKHAAISTASPAITFDVTPASGDVVVLECSTSAVPQTITIPAGWNNVLSGTTDVESDSNQACAVWQYADGSTATFTATNLYASAQTGAVTGRVYRYANPTTAIVSADSVSGFNSTNTATPHVFTGLTPNVTGGLYCAFTSRDAGGIYGPPPTSVDWATFNTNQARMSISEQGLTTSGVPIADRNVTPSSGDEYCSISYVIRPVSAATKALMWRRNRAWHGLQLRV